MSEEKVTSLRKSKETLELDLQPLIALTGKALDLSGFSNNQELRTEPTTCKSNNLQQLS